MSFAAATQVVQRDADYHGEILSGWDIAGNANGGYLAAIAARACSQATEGLLPVTVTTHYLAPGRPGPVVIRPEILKRGRRFTTVSAVLSDPGRPLLAVLGSFSDAVHLRDLPERVEATPPAMPDPDECIPLLPTEAFPPPFMGKVELRLHPEDAAFAAGVPRFRGWFRLPDDEPVDAFGLLVAVDAFPPTVFNAQLPVTWTPTLELTTHIRRRPEPGWLRCLFTTRFISGGYLEEDGEVWDSTGHLVAQSRQLALLGR